MEEGLGLYRGSLEAGISKQNNDKFSRLKWIRPYPKILAQLKKWVLYEPKINFPRFASAHCKILKRPAKVKKAKSKAEYFWTWIFKFF